MRVRLRLCERTNPRIHERADSRDRNPADVHVRKRATWYLGERNELEVLNQPDVYYCISLGPRLSPWQMKQFIENTGCTNSPPSSDIACLFMNHAYILSSCGECVQMTSSIGRGPVT